MLSKIRDILIIVNKGQLDQYKKIIPNGLNLGIKVSYLEQKFPRGLPEAFLIGEKFINKNNVALILGDNFFYGQNLTEKLIKCTKLKNGAKVFLHKVLKPELYGVAKLNKANKIISIKEKPKKYLSDLAITGLYYFDKKVVEYTKKLKPSKRNELEITDLLKIYQKKRLLSADLIGRGGAWMDTGSIDDFYKTSAFVSAVENRQGFKIACLEEIALNYKWITKKEIINSIKFYGKCDYSNYLQRLIKKN
jgi:glucose-1-phosphate thymidylyltransferase